MADALNLRDDVEDSLTSGELPSQGGSYVPTILPGIHLLKLPANIDQCWDAKDYPKKDANGVEMVYPAGTLDPVTQADLSGKPVVEQHLLLKFDRDNPLIVADGPDSPFDGLPATATITTMARRRGKKNDANAPMVSDMTYFLRDSLNDLTPIVKRKEYIPAVNKHAGAIIRIESGLSAQCDSERVRYIDDGAGGVVEDPNGVKGCDAAGGKPNSRLYTSDFKVSQFMVKTTGEAFNTREEAITAATAIGQTAADVKQIEVFSDRAWCKTCGAALRGFFRIERFLKPLASTQRA